MARREAIQQVGGLDESFFMYAEEVDWCYTMKQGGWEVWYEPRAPIFHRGGGSSQNRRAQREADMYRGRVYFFRKHYGDPSTGMLKAMIYGSTAIKILYHGTLTTVSGRRHGRPVVELEMLKSKLRGV